jgi:hypothetical protein
METRSYMDATNQIVEQLVALVCEDLDDKLDKLPKYLIIVGGAVALDLAVEDRSSVCTIGLTDLLGKFAVAQEGLILLDVRQQSTERDFLLRLVLLLVANDIGSVGIIQDGNTPVHNKQIDGMSLEILPCVTMYPGMEPLFAELQ